ncbi:WD40 repeat-like protein [Suillus weaverae]|nr:WD40 repeat-like protein [Suillus weaverae]
MSSSTSQTPAIMPRRTMRGHTRWVNGVVHLHGGRRQIITCSLDGSLRLWDLESCAQIGEDWRYENKSGMWSMALSPNGNTVASGSGSGDNNVRLWDIETRKVITKLAGHTNAVGALCWSADGNQVLSGSWDGTARVWDVESGETVLTIKTGHEWVCAVIYSPDATNIATGGRDEDAVKIWDAKTGKLFETLKHDNNDQVWSLAWTSDGKKLISGSRPIRIFDTTTWQELAILEGHTDWVKAISLSPNERLLVSASHDKTARLWNLDTNLQVGQPLQHERDVGCAALSADGELLVTACKNKNTYTWDIHAILKKAGLEDLLQPLSNVATQKSMNSNATRRPPIQVRRIPPAFFDGVQNGAQSSAARGTHHGSPAHNSRSIWTPLLNRFSSLFHHSHRDTDDATELQQRPRRSIFSRGPPIVEVAAVKDREVIFTAPPPPHKTQQQTQSHAQGSSTTPPAPGPNATTPRPRYPHSLPVRVLAHIVLFLCCASPQHPDGNAQQQQGQSQGQVHAQASSSQTEPAAPSTSATPTTPDTRNTAPVTASV